jgi:hypothetical protein
VENSYITLSSDVPTILAPILTKVHYTWTRATLLALSWYFSDILMIFFWENILQIFGRSNNIPMFLASSSHYSDTRLILSWHFPDLPYHLSFIFELKYPETLGPRLKKMYLMYSPDSPLTFSCIPETWRSTQRCSRSPSRTRRRSTSTPNMPSRSPVCRCWAVPSSCSSPL